MASRPLGYVSPEWCDRTFPKCLVFRLLFSHIIDPCACATTELAAYEILTECRNCAQKLGFRTVRWATWKRQQSGFSSSMITSRFGDSCVQRWVKGRICKSSARPLTD